MRREVVPTKGKEKQWEAFVGEADKLANRTSVRKKLRTLHEIFTSGSDLSLVHQERGAGTTLLLILDRPDGEEKHGMFSPILEQMGRRAEAENMPPIYLLMEGTRVLSKICSRDTEIDFDPQIKGKLRSLGRRRIAGREWQRVYCSHTCVFDEEYQGDFLPPMYYGLSTGLPETYQAFCDRCDELMAGANGFDQRILTEAFLQLVGTRLLHPFFDGNGRTFAGHLSLTLKTEGIDLSDYKKARGLTAELAPLNMDFLFRVLSDAGLRLIQDRDHISIILDHHFRKSYMERLRTAINKAIEQGIDPAGEYFEHYSAAVWKIRKYLVGRRSIPSNQEYEQRIEGYVQNNKKRLSDIPPSHQDYFMDKLRRYYIYHEDWIEYLYQAVDSLKKAKADEKDFGRLVLLMEFYEGELMVQLQLLYQFAQCLGSHKGRTLKTAEAFRDDEVKEAIRSWPEPSNFLNVVPLMWGHGFADGADSVRCIANAFQDQRIHDFHERYVDIDSMFDVGFEIVKTVALAVAKAKEHDSVAARLSQLPGDAPAETVVSMLQQIVEETGVSFEVVKNYL